MMRPVPRRGLPSLAQMWGGGVTGSACGKGLLAISTALHEFNERRYFSAAPVSGIYKRLNEMHDHRFAASVREALAQTANESGLDRLDCEAFDCTTAVEITTGRMVEVPTLLVSLRNHGKAHDFFPVNDSSGSAGHRLPENCYAAAVLEFVERQGLIAAWLSKRVERPIVIDCAPQCFAAETEMAISVLTSRGRIHLADISMGWPVHSCLAMFEATRGGCVRFAIGVAANLNAKIAIAKSIHELWQAYYHMEMMKTGRQWKKNRLEENYLAGNDAHSITGFGIDLDKRGPGREALISWANEPSAQLGELVGALGKISDNIAYFTSSIGWENQLLFYGVVKSPDFYLHLDVGRAINLRNRFALQAGIYPGATHPTSIPFA
jgi:hypothetical protein